MPEIWLEQALSSAEVRKGGVVKHQIRDVDRLLGRKAFAAWVARCGVEVVRNNRHFVILCNLLPIRRVRAEDGLSKARH